MTRKKEIFFGFLVLGFFGIVILGGAELYFRFFNPQLPAFLRPDPIVGTMHFSNFDVAEKNACVTAKIHFNKEGMNDTDHAVAKPPGVYRIAVIGDSYVEAMQFPLEQSFYKVLEKQLQDQGYKVEVLAFGVGGFGTLQEYYLLRDYALKYQPDLVILSFLTYNDIRNNSFQLEKSLDMPYATVSPEGQLQFQPFKLREEYVRAFQSPVRTLIFDHSHLVRYLYRLSNYSVRFRNFLAFFHLHTPAPKDSQVKDISNEVYLVNESSEWQKAWQVTDALIGKIKDTAAEHGAQFLLFSLSNDLQLSDKKFDQVRNQFPGQSVEADWPEEQLSRIAKEHDITYLSALPAMRELDQKGVIVHPACHGHWSAAASERAGELLSDFVKDHYLTSETHE